SPPGGARWRPAATPTGVGPGRSPAATCAAAGPPRSARAARSVGWSGAGPRLDTRGVRRPRTGHTACTLHAVDGSGSEVSLRDLPQHRLVQLGLGEKLLEAGVLALELLEPLRVAGLHAAVLSDPTMPGRLRDLQVPAHLVELGTAGEQLVALGELPDDLVGRVPPSLGHECGPPSPHRGATDSHNRWTTTGGSAHQRRATSTASSDGSRNRRRPPR